MFSEKSFCSLGKQFVVNPPMASHVLSKDRLAKLFELVRKNFHFGILCDIYVNKKSKP